MAMVAIVTLCLVLVGCSATVQGTPQSLVDVRMEQLIQKVDQEVTPETKRKMLWAEACNVHRELEASRPKDAEWNGDPLALQFDVELLDYYWMLVESGQITTEVFGIDFARFINGREMCDFMR
jgi:hypothetical protein